LRSERGAHQQHQQRFYATRHCGGNAGGCMMQQSDC
jgi:hypothetical protein